MPPGNAVIAVTGSHRCPIASGPPDTARTAVTTLHLAGTTVSAGTTAPRTADITGASGAADSARTAATFTIGSTGAARTTVSAIAGRAGPAHTTRAAGAPGATRCILRISLSPNTAVAAGTTRARRIAGAAPGTTLSAVPA